MIPSSLDLNSIEKYIKKKYIEWNTSDATLFLLCFCEILNQLTRQSENWAIKFTIRWHNNIVYQIRNKKNISGNILLVEKKTIVLSTVFIVKLPEYSLVKKLISFAFKKKKVVHKKNGSLK